MNIAEQIVEALLESAEHIVAASVRSPDGRVFNDLTHHDAYNKAAEALGVMADDIFASWDEGFTTSAGRFVDREQAYQIAKAAQQHRAADAKDPNEPWLEYGEVERDPRYWPKEMWPQQESVAVDLDGTLAKDSGWKGPEHIGEPVKPMLDLVRKLLDDGEEVVIFTARVHDGNKSTKEHIAQWLKDHDLPALEITNEKRPDMEKFYDDKAVAVKKNKGVSEAFLQGGTPDEMAAITAALEAQDMTVVSDSVGFADGYVTFGVLAQVHPASDQFVATAIYRVLQPYAGRVEVKRSSQKDVFLVSFKRKSPA